MWEFWLSSCSSLCTVVIACSWNYFPNNSQISNLNINIFVTWIILSILRNCASSWWHHIWFYILISTQSNQVPSMNCWQKSTKFIAYIYDTQIAKASSSKNNTFGEVYPFGKWVKGVSGMEVKWKWGQNVMKVGHSEVKVWTQWGKSRDTEVKVGTQWGESRGECFAKMSPGLRQLSPFYLAPPHPRSPMPCRRSSLLLMRTTMLVMMMKAMTMTMMLQLVKVVVCSGHWLSADFSIGSWINAGWRAYWSERGDLLMRTMM